MKNTKNFKKLIISIILIFISVFLVFFLGKTYFDYQSNSILKNNINEIFSNYPVYDESYKTTEYHVGKKEVFDLDIKYKQEDLKNGLVVLKFYNNKTSQLVDKIIHLENSDLKFLAISYLENYNFLNNEVLGKQVKSSNFTKQITELYFKNHVFNEEKLDEHLFAYYYLNSINNITFKNNIYKNLISNFDKFSENSKFKTFLYLSITGDLEIFLNDLNISFNNLYKQDLNVNSIIIYNYILNKINLENEVMLSNIDLIKKNYSEINDLGKIIFISQLKDLNYDEDYLNYVYSEFEKKGNKSLKLEDKLFKFIFFIDRFEEYNSFDYQNTFGYSIGSVHNRGEIFKLGVDKKNRLETYFFKDILYDKKIEFRLANLRFNKLYFDILIKK